MKMWNIQDIKQSGMSRLNNIFEHLQTKDWIISAKM